MSKRPFIRFDLISDSGKTKVVDVFSTHSGDYLGRIHWRCGWRCYVMSYNKDIDMSIGCHDELNDFMKHLEDIRKRDSSEKNNKE